MRFKLANKSHSFVYEFFQDGEYIVPDIGSVTWTLYGNDGSIGSQNNTALTTDASTNKVTLATSQGDNVISGAVEKRTIVIDYDINGQGYSDQIHYWITSLLNITVTEADVRAVLGVEPKELPDDAINIVEAYHDTSADLVNDITTILAAGDRSALKANRAITLKAALTVLPSLRLKVAQKETSDTIGYSRYTDMDWIALRDDLSAQYADALLQSDDQQVPDLALFVVSTPPDPVTGA